MKTKIYLLFFSLCFSLNLAAQLSPLDEKYSSLIIEEWTNAQWINSARMVNTFDTNGNKIKDGSDLWNDTTKVWESYLLNTHTLNANSTINFTLSQMWNGDSGSWEDFWKTIYTYNAAKNVLTEKKQMFFGIDWMDMSMITNTYNGSGQLTQSVEQTSDFISPQMENSTQYLYSYNADGTVNQEISQNWSTLNNAWENDTRTTNTYNNSKKLISIVDEVYGLGAWVNDSKTTLTYNGDGTMNEVLYQAWDASGEKWVDSEKELYSHNADGSTSQVLGMEWNPGITQWENATRITLLYTSTSIQQPVTGTDQLKVYPNPFRNGITLDYHTLNEFSIQIYNASGQLVKSIAKGLPLSFINLSSLQSGVYMLQVTTPESQKVVRMVKGGN